MFHKSIVCCYLYPITKYGYPPPAERTVSYLQEMKDLGFQTIELEGIQENHLNGVFEGRFEIKDKLGECRLHLPYFCVVLPGLSSAEAQVREKNLALFEKGCEIAALWGCSGVLDNGPIPPYEFPENMPAVRHYDEAVFRIGRFPKTLDWKRYWEELTAAYQTACEIAAQAGLTYHLHPCFGSLTASSDGFLYFYDAVGRDNLRFNLDTANQFALKEDLTLALRRLSDYIDYIHLSDNRGLRMEHLLPGAGQINWDDFFETLHLIGFKGHIGLDIGG
ncbi:sugar phosphate isomerase/epimerase, partial [candidate division KSB1 bacterium]|nr:sugar phosphate isomerase/epimerase [candidate division KSB1 bacterium]